ncbi:hypothetical protein [Rhodococcus sp. USK13]|uniref:hypothetical protein n=1 Tax=Rhodococcus sp. USK13 TaxID=2806442 RepID=UPI001BCB162C|nr:hypothetical protein [Rhodococcus sp. USK13]
MSHQLIPGQAIVLVFSVPEAGILGNAYVLSQPNVGATISSGSDWSEVPVCGVSASRAE